MVARSRRNSPAAKTIISTAPSAVIAWKANSTPALVGQGVGDAGHRAVAELVAVDDVDGRAGDDGARAGERGADAGDRPEAGRGGGVVGAACLGRGEVGANRVLRGDGGHRGPFRGRWCAMTSRCRARCPGRQGQRGSVAAPVTRPRRRTPCPGRRACRDRPPSRPAIRGLTSSGTSQTLTFMAARIRSWSSSQNATNSRLPSVAAHHDAGGVVAGRVADVLHAEVVLVAEEVRQPVVGRVLAQDRRRGGRRLVERGGPVLDPDPAAEHRVVVVGDVADRVDVGVAGAQRPVDEDAVVDVEPGRLGELGAGPDADAEHDRVGGELLAVLES